MNDNTSQRSLKYMNSRNENIHHEWISRCEITDVNHHLLLHWLACAEQVVQQIQPIQIRIHQRVRTPANWRALRLPRARPASFAPTNSAYWAGKSGSKKSISQTLTSRDLSEKWRQFKYRLETIQVLAINTFTHMHAGIMSAINRKQPVKCTSKCCGGWLTVERSLIL